MVLGITPNTKFVYSLNSWDKTQLFFAIYAKVMYNIRQGGGT